MSPEETCKPPRTWLGRLWLRIYVRYLAFDDGETLVCERCGGRLYLD